MFEPEAPYEPLEAAPGGCPPAALANCAEIIRKVGEVPERIVEMVEAR